MIEQEARNRLRAAIEATGGQFKFAAMYGVTDAYVDDVVHSKPDLGDRILAMVGIERIGTQQIAYRET
jgi:hypothetical protein